MSTYNLAPSTAEEVLHRIHHSEGCDYPPFGTLKGQVFTVTNRQEAIEELTNAADLLDFVDEEDSPRVKAANTRIRNELRKIVEEIRHDIG